MRTLALLCICLLCHGCGGGASAFSPTPMPAPPAPGSTAFGPPWVTGQDSNGVGWTGCVDYESPRDGDGCFIQFLSLSKSGKQVSGITLNGGLVDATAGKEQGDLDIGIMVDGKQGYVIAFVPQGIVMWPPDFFALGSPTSRWKSVYLTTVPCPANVPGSPQSCVSVNGGVVGVY